MSRDGRHRRWGASAPPPGPPPAGRPEDDDEERGEELDAASFEPYDEPREEARPRPRLRRHRLANALTLLVFAGTAFAIGLWVFNGVVMPRLIHSVSEVRVPDLSNLTFAQAQEVVRPLGLPLSRAGERFDPSVPTGFILSQDPQPDTPVRGKRRVTVVVSLGEEFSSVPEVYGESLRGARLLIERAGLKVGGITRAPSEDVGADLVMGTDPIAESVLPRDTPVALLVSTGGGEETFVMPDLIGREIGSVRRQLEALGYRVLVPPAGASVGPIVSQDPGAGARIRRDATIVLQATGRMIR